MPRYFKTFSALLRDDMTRYWHHSVPFIHKEVGLTFRPLVARWGGAGRLMRGGEWPVPCCTPLLRCCICQKCLSSQNCLLLSKWWGRWMACAMLYSPNEVLHLSKIFFGWWSNGMQLRMVTRFLVPDYGRGRLKRSRKLLQCNFCQWQIFDEVYVTFWEVAIYKYVEISYLDFRLVWLFWLLTWPLTLWFIILPKVLRSLPTSRRDHFLLLCSRELLIWAKLAAARKSGFWADCSGERGRGGMGVWKL